MTFQIVDSLGNTFTHLSSDLPLPAGDTAPGRGATSVEMDTGRVLRYHQPNRTWYVLSGPTFASSISPTYGAVDSGFDPSSGLVSRFVSDGMSRAVLDEMLVYLRAIAHALAVALNQSLDELIDESAELA